MNTDGSGLLRLTRYPDDDKHPSFSRDGSKIVFVRQLSLSSYEIFIMNADGSNAKQITHYSAISTTPCFAGKPR